MLVPQAQSDWTPEIDVSRDGQSIQVTVLLPGATENDIEVEIRDGPLMISGEMQLQIAPTLPVMGNTMPVM